jgi:hypothetical protein
MKHSLRHNRHSIFHNSAATLLLWILLLLSTPNAVQGQIDMSCAQPTHTQLFDNIAPTSNNCTAVSNIAWVDNVTVPGWFVSNAPGPFRINANDMLACGLAGLYSLGTNNNSERALGSLLGGSLVPTIGAQFRNTSPRTITELIITYTGEQWRRGSGSADRDRLDFQFSTNATSLATGTWTDVNTLDFQSPNVGPITGGLDGNLPANRQVITDTIRGLSIPPGSTFWIRWRDFDVAGTDDALGIDDFTLTINNVPHPGGVTITGSTCAGGTARVCVSPLPAPPITTLWSLSPSLPNFFAINNCIDVSRPDAGVERRFILHFDPATNCISQFPRRQVNITFTPPTAPGTITGGTTVCPSPNTVTFTLAGNVGTVVRWESSPDNFATPARITNIANTTNTLTLSNVPTKIYVRAVVRNGTCPEVTSPADSVVIDRSTAGGNILPKDLLICNIDNFTRLTLNNFNGRVVQWESTTDDFVNLNVIPVTTPFLDVEDLTVTTRYRAIITSPRCPAVLVQSDTATIVIAATRPLDVTARATNVSCAGLSTGSIVLTISNAVGPFTYVWRRNGTPFVGTDTLRNITNGDYAVTVTDANRCTASLNISVTAPPPLNISAPTIINPRCNGFANGSINFSTFGGTPPYTYVWQDFVTSPNRVSIPGGDYGVTITDANGCRLIRGFLLTQPAPLTINLQAITHVNCTGEANGSIGVDIKGGTRPYRIAWETGDPDEDVSNLAAGFYSVTVVDANACVRVDSFQIVEPPALNAQVQVLSTPICAGQLTGRARVNILGGTPPYVKLWSNSQRGDTATGLSGGPQSVDVTDARGCRTRVNFIVPEPDSLRGVITSINNIRCFNGTDGRVRTTISGGTPPYTYEWSGTAQLTADLVDLRAGTYNLTITDSKGCTSNLSATITQPVAPLSAELVAVRDLTCKNGTDGIIDIEPRGGTLPYTYLWTNGTLTFTTQDLINVPAGRYNLSLRDRNGCRFAESYVIETPDSLLTINTSFVNNTNCFGDSTGGIAINVSGGEGPYRYRWSTNDTTEGILNIPANFYVLTVTDANGCQAQRTFEVKQPSAMVITLIQAIPPTCQNGADGILEVIASGGTAPYSYDWNVAQFTPRIIGLTARKYDVVVTDANGCTATFEQELVNPNGLRVNLDNRLNPRCNGSRDGVIDIRPIGGRAPYRFNWTRNNIAFGTAEDLFNVPIGEYAVTITDADNCRALATYTLTEPAALATAVTNLRNATCSDRADGRGTVEVTGGTAPYTFFWSITSWTRETGVDLRAADYAVRVTDANNCRLTQLVTITAPVPLTVSPSKIQNIACRGESVIAGTSASIELAVNGGTAPYTYLWSTNATTPSISGMGVGDYFVTVTDANSCTKASDRITITQPASPLTVTVSYIDNESCDGFANGAIGLDVFGGAPPYTYRWSNGRTREDITNLTPGFYEVTVTDANGCRIVRSATVGGPVNPLSIETSFITPILCNGAATGAIAVDAVGGTPPHSFTWSNNSPNHFIQNLRAGDYTVTVRDARGCRTQRVYTLTEPGPIVIQPVRVDSITCESFANGAIDIEVNGGTLPYTFRWSNNATTQNINGLIENVYVVNVIDANGCIESLAIPVKKVNILRFARIDAKNVTCTGTRNGAIDIDVIGGQLPYTFLWSNLATTEDIDNLGGGTYTVVVSDRQGCVIQTTVRIEEGRPLAVNVGLNRNVICHGESNGALVVNVTGGREPYRYNWSNGETTRSIANLSAGRYIVTVTDQDSCVTIFKHDITQPDSFFIEPVYVRNVRCKGGNNGAIRYVGRGGVPPYSYVWNTGVTRDEILNLSPGNYRILVQDRNRCSAVASVNITEPEALRLTVEQIKNVSCNGTDRGLIDISIDGGTRPYRFNWSNARTSEDISGIVAGTYTVVVTDANDCVLRQEFRIVNETLPLADLTGLPAVACRNAAPITLSGVPSGGRFGGRGVSGNSFNPRAAGLGRHRIFYAVDVRGCTLSDTAFVDVVAPPSAAALVVAGNPLDSFFCASDERAYSLTYAPVQTGVFPIFSGPGVVAPVAGRGQFFPSRAGAGTHVLNMILRNSRTNCDTLITKQVTVTEPFLLTVTSDNPVKCSDESAVLAATGAISYDWAPSDGLTCAPNCLNAGAFVGSTASRTTTYTVTGYRRGCVASQTFTQQVSNDTLFRLEADRTTVCAGVPFKIRAISDANYQYAWAPFDVLDDFVGQEVTAVLKTTTTFTVNGISSGGCQRLETITINVLPAQVELTASRDTICPGESVTLTARSLETGSFTFSWGPAAGLNTTTGPIVIASPTKTTTYTVTRSGTGSCRELSRTIVVRESSASISGLGTRFCIDDVAAPLVGTPAGGTFVGPGVTAGTFVPSIAGLGTHTISYVGRGTNGCLYRADQIVEVQLTGSARIVGLASNICIISSPVTLTGVPAGGTFSGPGVSGGRFNPETAGAGSHVIRYVGTNPGGSCRFDITQTVRVQAAVSASTGLAESYCASANPITLSGTPAGGTFAGPGIAGGQFSPRSAGVGAHLITYSGSVGPCAYSISTPVRVIAAPNIRSITSNAPSCPSCSDGSIVVDAVAGAGTLRYSINGGTSFQDSRRFDRLAAGSYVLVVRDASGCDQRQTVTLGTVAACPTPTIGAILTRRTSLIVSWPVVSGATSYTLSWREDRPSAAWISVNIGINNFTITGLAPNTAYQVRLRANCSPTVSSPFSAIVIRNTTNTRIGDLDESNKTLTAAVYPNPNTGNFQVLLSALEGGELSATPIELAVYNLAGQRVFYQQMALSTNEQTVPVDLGGIAAGVYWLTIERPGVPRQSLKLIVQ